MRAVVFGVDALVILLILLVPASFGLAIWALIDAASRPDVAFQRAGQSKVLWIILPIVGALLLGPVGGILGLVYLTAIRPKVKVHQEPPGLFYAPSPQPPPGWWLASDGRWYPPETAR